MIQRQIYLDWLELWREKQLIKVVSGVRRCGKSTLFEQYVEYLNGIGVANEQIISINLEDVDNEYLLNHLQLHTYVKERLCKDRYTYVFIDEVQKCPEFERVVDSLFIKKNVDVYITGSNAKMLSGELATLLSGRYVEIQMLPLSFTEYLSNGEKNQNISHKFDEYLKYGAFPYVVMLQNNRSMIRSYLDGIYNTILIKDVATRNDISDIVVLEAIVKFLCGNIGSLISAKKISDTINSTGRRISVNTVDRYLKALCDSFLFYKVERYDIKGRQTLKTLGKYYVVDLGLREMLISSQSADIGHLLENIVYFELLRRGAKVKIGKLLENEVDFVCEDINGITYYQVAASTLDESTLQRELTPLNRIKDHHPKILLTLDEYISNGNYQGIRKMNVLEWLVKS